MLGEISYGLIFGEGHQTFIGRQFSHDDPKKRSLARAVDADNGGFFIVLYMKRYIFQYRNFMKRFMDIADG